MDVKFKTFQIKDIFKAESSKAGDSHVPTGNQLPEKMLIPGDTPRVSAKNSDNGIIGYFRDVDDLRYITEENCISVSSMGSVFYQPGKTSFSIKIHILKPINHELQLAEALYLVAVLRKKLSKRSFKSQISSTELASLEITLPERDGLVSWEDMRNIAGKYERKYVSKVKNNVLKGIKTYMKANGLKSIALTVYEWTVTEAYKTNSKKKFLLSDLFEIKKGRRLPAESRGRGSTPYISASQSGNGITEYIDHEPLYPGNSITVNYNGSVGEVFYQKEPFWASDDVNVLLLKDRELNDDLFCFLAAAIKRAGKSFSYKKKWNTERMEKTGIVLPEKNGKPDYDFMELYGRAKKKAWIYYSLAEESDYVAYVKRRFDSSK